jgi:hypothetical protein
MVAQKSRQAFHLGRTSGEAMQKQASDGFFSFPEHRVQYII